MKKIIKLSPFIHFTIAIILLTIPIVLDNYFQYQDLALVMLCKLASTFFFILMAISTYKKNK